MTKLYRKALLLSLIFSSLISATAIAQVATSSVGGNPHDPGSVSYLIWAIRNGEILLIVGFILGQIGGLLRQWKIPSMWDGWPNLVLAAIAAFAVEFGASITVAGQDLFSALTDAIKLAVPILSGLWFNPSTSDQLLPPLNPPENIA